MNIQYSASNFTETDLPTDGSCEFQIDITNYSTASPSSSQLNTWPLEGNESGVFLPNSSKAPGSRINSTGYNRAEVFEGLQTIGAVSLDGSSDSFPMDFLLLDGDGSVVENNNTNRTTRIAFAAQNLGSSTSFDMTVKILLADGTYASSSPTTITVPADAVKTNLVASPTINSYTTTTAAYGVQNGGVGGNPPTVALTGADIRVSALNSGNSFTTPNADVGVGMAQGFQDPPSLPANQILHSWQVNVDTSTLNLADFPATLLFVEYEFSWDADETNIDPSLGIFWDAETGAASIPTGSGPIFTITAQDELDGINTDTIIPFASVALPVIGDFDRDYNTAWKAYSASVGDPVGAPYSVNLKVRIRKSDLTFVESPVVALNITDGGVLPTLN